MTKRFTTLLTICSAVLVAVFYAPSAFADTTVRIEGNGAFSDNDIQISDNTTTRITQSNTANISNTVNASANTGNNSSSFNTGGDTLIDTGDAQTNVRIDNDVNKNVLLLNGCGCDSNDIHASIDGNGAFSDNQIDVDQNHTVDISQHNNADIDNRVNAKANTGKNDASFNTGNVHPWTDNEWWNKQKNSDWNNICWSCHTANLGGDTTIRTGDATSNVWISNSANVNFLRM